MKKQSNTGLAAIGILTAGLMLPSVTVAALLPTVASYDPNNRVDNVAGVDDASTVAAGSSTTFSTFKSAVSTAHANNFGGVANFDSFGSDVGLGASHQFQYGASASKTLNFTSSTNLRSAGYGSATPLSGSRVFDAGNGSTSTFTLSFGTITNGVLNERVTQFAVTALSRSTSSSGGTMTLTATFDNNTTSVLSSAIATTNGNDDTFYHFAAPTGRYITSVAFNQVSGGTRPFDDLGIITSVVPEPGSLALIGLAGAAMIRRRR